MKVAYRNYDLPSLVECVRRTVFNILCGNDDAHLKNWSLVYRDRRNAVLSPAYDLVCTAVILIGPRIWRSSYAARRSRRISVWMISAVSPSNVSRPSAESSKKLFVP